MKESREAGEEVRGYLLPSDQGNLLSVGSLEAGERREERIREDTSSSLRYSSISMRRLSCST